MFYTDLPNFIFFLSENTNAGTTDGECCSSTLQTLAIVIVVLVAAGALVCCKVRRSPADAAADNVLPTTQPQNMSAPQDTAESAEPPSSAASGAEITPLVESKRTLLRPVRLEFQGLKANADVCDKILGPLKSRKTLNHIPAYGHTPGVGILV